MSGGEPPPPPVTTVTGGAEPCDDRTGGEPSPRDNRTGGEGTTVPGGGAPAANYVGVYVCEKGTGLTTGDMNTR